MGGNDNLGIWFVAHQDNVAAALPMNTEPRPAQGAYHFSVR